MARFSHEFCPGIHCDPGNLRWMVGGHQHTSYRRRPFSGDQRYDKLLNFLSIETCLLSGAKAASLLEEIGGFEALGRLGMRALLLHGRDVEREVHVSATLSKGLS